MAKAQSTKTGDDVPVKKTKVQVLHSFIDLHYVDEQGMPQNIKLSVKDKPILLPATQANLSTLQPYLEKNIIKLINS